MPSEVKFKFTVRFQLTKSSLILNFSCRLLFYLFVSICNGFFRGQNCENLYFGVLFVTSELSY